MNAFLTICALFMAVCFWGLICNERTHSQVMRIIDAIYDSPDWGSLSKAFRSVSYLDHMFALMRFRDPLTLYDQRIQRLMGREIAA